MLSMATKNKLFVPLRIWRLRFTPIEHQMIERLFTVTHDEIFDYWVDDPTVVVKGSKDLLVTVDELKKFAADEQLS